MESSRLFVKNLPPTITEADFRKHFTTGGREVTDVKLIAKRRIGYVGFRTPQEAAKAVKYFNRSYIRMSKIAVEIARPISDPALPTTNKVKHVACKLPTPEPEHQVKENGTKTNDRLSVNDKKRKRDALYQSDPKLREFLEVMRPGQKTASRLEGIYGQYADMPSQGDAPMVSVEAESDEEYEEISAHAHKMMHQKEEIANAVSVQSAAPATNDAPQNPATTNATDDDWLRSRTNRLLDLVDPDDPVAFASVAARQEQLPAVVASCLSQVEDVGIANAYPEAEPLIEQAGATVDGDNAKEKIRRTSRLFLRNLSFKATEAELRTHFEKYGEVEEVHIPVSSSGKGKGFAHVLFAEADSAIAAFGDADGKFFQGRLLHILPGLVKREQQLDEFAISRMPLRKQNLLRKKAQASSMTFNWNSLYMNQDAVLASTAERLGMSKSELLDPTSTDAAVKQAFAETQIIQETKNYFSARGTNLDVFKSQKKGDTAILVKNLPHGTSLEELRKLFEEAAGGHVLQVLMPPSRIIAIVQFSQPVACRTAFAKLAYRRIGSSILFLEKAPADLFADQQPLTTTPSQNDRPASVQKVSVADLLEREDNQDDGETTSVYVKNLSFDTTTEQLSEAFRSLDGFVKAQVKSKLDPKKPGQVLSMGFGFIHFRTKAQAEAAVMIMNGYVLDGHILGVRTSHKGHDAAEERRREDKAKKAAGQRTKIVVKNLAFEASKADLRHLLGAYGKLRVVRIPKKFGNSSRGFAFAEFESPGEAENCIKSLKHTHLLGRRLVLDYADAEAVDAEEEIAKMQEKIKGQVKKMAVQRLTGTGRQRFGVGEEDGDDA